MDKSSLPYRDNVCGIVFKNNRFLLLQRIDWPDNWWKFPQGGVEDQETDEQAVVRELQEELGMINFEVVGKSIHTNKYDWDDISIMKAGNRWRGQNQKFFLINFKSNDKDIILAPEIKTFRWVDKNDLEKYININNQNFSNYFSTINKILEEFSEKLA